MSVEEEEKKIADSIDKGNSLSSLRFDSLFNPENISIEGIQNKISELTDSLNYNAYQKKKEIKSDIYSDILNVGAKTTGFLDDYLPNSPMTGGIKEIAYGIMSQDWEPIRMGEKALEGVVNTLMPNAISNVFGLTTEYGKYKGFTPDELNNYKPYTYPGTDEEIDVLRVFLGQSINNLPSSDYYPTESWTNKKMNQLNNSGKFVKGDVPFYSIKDFTIFSPKSVVSFSNQEEHNKYISDKFIVGSNEIISDLTDHGIFYKDIDPSKPLTYRELDLMAADLYDLIDAKVKEEYGEEWTQMKTDLHLYGDESTEASILNKMQRILATNKTDHLSPEWIGTDLWKRTRVQMSNLFLTGEYVSLGGETRVGGTSPGRVINIGGVYTPIAHLAKPDEDTSKERLDIINFDTEFDLGSYSASLNFDEENGKYYVAIFDAWDFNEGEGTYGEDTDKVPELTYTRDMNENEQQIVDKSNQAKMLEDIGTAIPIYDRYYIDDDIIEQWKEYFHLTDSGAYMEDKGIEPIYKNYKDPRN